MLWCYNSVIIIAKTGFGWCFIYIWKLGLQVEGSWLKLQGKAGRCSGTSGRCQTTFRALSGTLEQGAEPADAHIGTCQELSTHPGVDPTFTHSLPPRDPLKEIKRLRRQEERHTIWYLMQIFTFCKFPSNTLSCCFTQSTLGGPMSLS